VEGLTIGAALGNVPTVPSALLAIGSALKVRGTPSNTEMQDAVYFWYSHVKHMGCWLI